MVALDRFVGPHMLSQLVSIAATSAQFLTLPIKAAMGGCAKAATGCDGGKLPRRGDLLHPPRRRSLATASHAR
jgi:hypothetical protein